MKRTLIALFAAAAFVCSCEKPVAAPEGTVQRVGDATELPCDGGVAEFDVNANCDWTVTVPEGITATPEFGVANVPTKVVVTVPENQVMDKVDYEIVFTLTNSKAEIKEIKQTVSIAATDKLFYGGVGYKTALMKDGNIWMTENLRYVPQGKTPSDQKDDASGFWYPIICDGTNLKFGTDPTDVDTWGYLYSAEFVFGAKKETVGTGAGNFAGAQGICPDGWHIPTVEECVGLVGKSNKDLAGNDLTDVSAPYYDTALSNGSLMKLLEDGNAFAPCGMVTYANSNTTTGTLGTATGTAPEKYMNTGYFMGSTMYQCKDNTDGSYNIQFFALMPHAKNGTINVSYLGYRFGVSVRCVKNK